MPIQCQSRKTCLTTLKRGVVFILTDTIVTGIISNINRKRTNAQEIKPPDVKKNSGVLENLIQ